MRCYNIFCFIKWELLYCMFISWKGVSGEIRYSIPEELQLGAFVGNIADDLGSDVKQLSARNFRLVSDSKKQYLEVHLDNGILFVKERIDREELCGPSLTCVLSMEAVLENPLNLYQIEVDILDINDNAPRFPKSQFRLEISELAAPGARFALECAHDPDVGPNSVQTYQLIANEYFVLNVEAGIRDGKLPMLVLEKPLDREKRSTHRLLLLAKDGGVPERSGTAQINIVLEDANDNAPVFPQSVYRIELPENVTKGTLVLQVNATDLDEGSNGEIVYSFSSHTSARVRKQFTLDSKSGEIRVKTNLDYEEHSVFEIIIQAKDNGAHATPVNCHVVLNIIDVNDNAPEVTLTSLSSPIPEDSLPGTVVALISASDRDSGENGQLRCRVGNNLPFALDSSSKKYLRLLTQDPLDRESASTFNVTVTCSDGGSPPLTANKTIPVEVSDRNDNAPQFAQPVLTAYVMENNNIGASIFSVTAFDADIDQNARLSYAILDSRVQGESVSNYVYINSENGIIYSYRSFDYEQLKNFRIQVRAHDRGVPPLASNVSIDIIILDQNDNAPVIVYPLSEYGSTATETLSRFAEPGYLVVKMAATDADSGQNARLSYQIIHATKSGLFTISSDTGEIWTARDIAKTDSSKQRLVILVSDHGTPALSATMSITLSVVEGDAEMLSGRSSLPENRDFASDTSLYLVISLGIISSIFLVVLIILAVKVHKNRNAFGGHNCALGPCCCFESRHSMNGIQKARRNLQIPPNYVEVFGGDPLSQSFRYETCSTSRSIKRDFLFPNTCSSSTGKNQAKSGIIANGGKSAFSNSENSIHREVRRLKGIIQRRRVVLSHSKCFVLEMEHYKIYWLLKWQLLYSIISSWELVSGQIRYSIPEELNVDAFVGNIAEDLGLDINDLSARGFQIVSGPSKQYMDVNLDNGILFVKETMDREMLCGPSLACTLSLEAVIENPLNVYHFQVEILDVNDNAPSFPESQLRLEISEVAAPGTRFALECAHDPDVGSNSVQSYQLAANGYFALDVETRGGDGKLPVLVLERPLDREQESTYRLVLTARDGGSPERSGTAQILIAIEDANDNAPVFPQSVYRVSLLENVPTGTLVTKVAASDLDVGLNGQVVYSFSSHTSNRVRELFGLDSKTGEIRIKKNLDYEENSVFEINVQAKDKGAHATPAYCHVVVDIVDVNDNAPEVTLTSIFSPIGEDSLPGTVVALISSTDKDSGENGHVHCQIPNELPFKLDSSLNNYYRLVTRETLDREHVPNYSVAIVCSDAGIPPLTCNKTIRVEVSDINDYSPHFAQPLYTAYMMENNAIGASIFSVAAFDPDLSQNARLSYFILETLIQGNSVSTYVSINSHSGVIFSRRTFDYEQLKNFQLQVQAWDSGVPPLSGNTSVDVIILDQNDNAPVIVHPLPEFGSTVLETLSRFAEPGYLVAKVSATDSDTGQNARLTYQILQATDAGLFTISPDTGEIWTIRGIVKHDATKQRLLIGVKDNGSPPLTATATFLLSVVGTDKQMLSDVSSLSEDPGFVSDISFYLVITLGVISSIFLVILIVLAIKVHKSFSLETCGCFAARNSLHGVQRGGRNLQIPPNYVEVFGGDPLSQSFRYDTCSSSHSTKREFTLSNRCSASTRKNNVPSGTLANRDTPRTPNSAQYKVTANNEVKQPNTDWRFSQTHRAELNSSQYLEEEGVQRDIQREVQREVQRDLQRDVPHEVQCEVSRNIQRDVQRDVQCDVQHAAEKDPGGPRKQMCARPVPIPAGRDGWTIPRTAPRMHLQMTLGAQVPGTLRSQYLLPREPHTTGARISNSSVEFSGPLVGSLHGPRAANHTRDHRGVTGSGSRRPELDAQDRGEIPCSPPGHRLSTQRLHSRDHDHDLREVNN
uniref:uncharacterized protein n=1 Tax=Pristiophorus japonicus TaxID=55135 RepID=UPI00398ED6B3